MLDVDFNYFKELCDEWLKKSKQLSGRVQYAESETQFFCYLWTTEWKFRCIVNKNEVSDIDVKYYIRTGRRINGRVTDTEDSSEIIENLQAINEQLTEINNREKIKEFNEQTRELDKNAKRK